MPTFFLMHIPQDGDLTEKIAHELDQISPFDVVLNEDGDLASIGATIPTADVVGILLTHQALCTPEIHAGFTAARAQKKRVILLLGETLDKQLLLQEWEDFDFEKTAQQNWRLLKRVEWLDFRNKRDFFRTVQKLATRLQANFIKRLAYRKLGWQPQRTHPATRLAVVISFIAVALALGLAIWAIREADSALDDRHDTQQELAQAQTAQVETYAPVATQLASQNSLYWQAGDLQLTQQALRIENENAIQRGNALQSVLWTNFAQQNLAYGNLEIALPLAVASYRFDVPPLPESIETINLAANYPLPQFDGAQPPHDGDYLWSISADATYLALAQDQEVRIWETDALNATPQPYTLNNSGTIRAMVFSPDNQYLLISTDDNEIIVLNTANAEFVQSWQLTGTVAGALFASNNQSVATAETSPDGQSALVLRNIQSGEVEIQLTGAANQEIARFTLHPHNDWFMVAYTDGSFGMGQLVDETLPAGTATSPGSYTSLLIFSDTGEYALRTECSRTETACRLIRHDFDDYSQAMLGVLDFPVDTINIASAWHTAYAAGCDQTCQFAQIDLITGETQLVDLETWDYISQIGINTASHEVISVSNHYGLIRWETLVQPHHYTLAEAEVIQPSPDGETVVATLENGTLAVYDAQTGDYQQDLAGEALDVMRMAFSRDGARMVTISRTEPIKLWDMLTHELIRSFEMPLSQVVQVAISQDRRSVIGTTEMGELVIWDATTGAIDRNNPVFETSEVQSVAISDDHNWGIAATKSGLIFVWDLVNMSLMRQFDVPNITDVQFVPNDWAFVTVSRSGNATWRYVQSGNVSLTQFFNDVADWKIGFLEDSRNVVFYTETGAHIWNTTHDTIYPAAVNITALDDLQNIVFTGEHNHLWMLDADNQAYWWTIQEPEDLIEQLYASTTIRELTCTEREIYHFEPSCVDNVYPTRTPYRATASHTPTTTPSPTVTASPTNDPSIPSLTPSPTSTLFEIPTVTIAPSNTPSSTPTPEPTETLPVISAFALEQ